MENRITYRKRGVSEHSTQILSIPWSYLITGLTFLIIGILDFKFLGNHIGHPGESGFGERIGQGTAVFLGGLSFAWTTGLAPLIVGGIMIAYCIYATKFVTLTPTANSYIIQEQRILFPLITEIDRSKIRTTKYTNRGLKLRHLWILLFIPMGIRILQYGFPLFNEHLAEDNILPIMLVLTGFVDILGTVLTLIVPTHTLSFQTDLKLYEVNFLPVYRKGDINRTFELTRNEASVKDGRRRDSIFRLIAGIGLIIVSSIGLSVEYLWGTDLSMVGISYGIYLVLHVVQNDSKLYFQNSITTLPESTEYRQFRKISFIDVAGLGLLMYLSTLDFIWGWTYISSNWLTILDMILATLIWLGVLIWIFLYLTVPLQDLKNINAILKRNTSIPWKFGLRIGGMVVMMIFAIIIAF